MLETKLSLVNQRFCLELFQVWHPYKSAIETTLSVCTIRKYILLTLIKILESRNKLQDSRWRKWKLCLLLSKIFLYFLRVLVIGPLHPNISLQVLHTFLHTFPNVMTRRICLTIKSLIDDRFLYSHDLNVWFKGDIVRRI